MFPMSPLQTWTTLLLVVMLVIFTLVLIHDFEAWLAEQATTGNEGSDVGADAQVEQIYDWAVQGL